MPERVPRVAPLGHRIARRAPVRRGQAVPLHLVRALRVERPVQELPYDYAVVATDVQGDVAVIGHGERDGLEPLDLLGHDQAGPVHHRQAVFHLDGELPRVGQPDARWRHVALGLQERRAPTRVILEGEHAVWRAAGLENILDRQPALLADREIRFDGQDELAAGGLLAVGRQQLPRNRHRLHITLAVGIDAECLLAALGLGILQVALVADLLGAETAQVFLHEVRPVHAAPARPVGLPLVRPSPVGDEPDLQAVAAPAVAADRLARDCSSASGRCTGPEDRRSRRHTSRGTTRRTGRECFRRSSQANTPPDRSHPLRVPSIAGGLAAGRDMNAPGSRCSWRGPATAANANTATAIMTRRFIQGLRIESCSSGLDAGRATGDPSRGRQRSGGACVFSNSEPARQISDLIRSSFFRWPEPRSGQAPEAD